MKIITESEMNFGKFDETNLFHIENSKIYKVSCFWKQRKVVQTLPIVMNQRKKNRNLKNIIRQNNKE